MKKTFIIFMLMLVSSSSLYAQKNVTGLPLPRFASLRAAEVNLRSGPGTQYAKEWVIKRKYLPVKVIAEHGNWRKIQLHDDTIGWVFQSMLTGNKTVLVKKKKAHLRNKPSKEGVIKAHPHKNVIGHLKTCKKGWCKAHFGSYSGYLEQSILWGAEFEKK